MPHPRAAGPPPWSRSEEIDTRTRSLETVARRERANPLKSLLATHGTSRETNWCAGSHQ